MWNNQLIESIINKERDFIVRDSNGESYSHTYEPNEFRALIVDEAYNFRLFVEFTKVDALEYKSVKDKVHSDNYNDSDKVKLMYFCVLEVF